MGTTHANTPPNDALNRREHPNRDDHQRPTGQITTPTEAERGQLLFIDDLAKKNRTALGFLPRAAYTYLLDRQRIHILNINGQPAGYIAAGPNRPTTIIYQIVITDELRRVEHGRQLIEHIKTLATNTPTRRLQCHCATDLPANQFWTHIGFTRTGQRIRSKKRQRIQHRYTLQLSPTATTPTTRPLTDHDQPPNHFTTLLRQMGINLADLRAGPPGGARRRNAH